MVSTATAQAAYTCAKHKDLVKILEGMFDEYRKGAGIGKRGHMLELFVSEKVLTLYSRPIFMGEDWRDFDAKPEANL